MMQCKFLKAIVFDCAGTTIDYGSRAPTIVFQEIFRRRGVEITIAESRGPMGMPKRDHMAAIGAMERVAKAWRERHQRPFEEADIDEMYEAFLPLQKETLFEHCALIPGAAEAVAQCREMGLRIGSTTGYTQELMEVVSEAAARQGYRPDCVLCAEDAPRGRPAPYLLYEAAKRLDVYPTWTMVKVDDTPVGIQAGRNAGCWTIGVTLTGNCVGLSEQQLSALGDAEVQSLRLGAAEQLRDAGAHFTVDSVADIPALLATVDRRAIEGELPI